MLKLQILHLAKLIQSQSCCVNLSTEFGSRICGALEKRIGHVVCTRHLHKSRAVRKDDNDSPDTLNGNENPLGQKKQSKGIPIDSNLRSAASDAAKELPGDWNKTAEALIARLSAHKVAAQESEDTGSPPVENDKSKLSLLETLNVRKSRKQGGFNQVPRWTSLENDEDSYTQKSSVEQVGQRSARQMQIYKDLFEVPRLGIFDAEKVKSQVDQQQPVIGKGLWEEKTANLVRLAQGGVPRNAWEEQIEWTKQGKLWSFPINNEADMHEERQYKFHEHVFLERHLGEDFPATGPIRKFMSLVCLGLSQSPWLTVPEKVEHIRWFVGYFREKQDVLEASIPGEEGRMPDTGDQRRLQ